VKDTFQKALRRGHNEGNIRQRTDGRWEVRLSAGIDYKTGKPRRTSTCCNTRQEAIAILQQQAHEVRTQGWRDPMSVTLGEWYEYWLDTYMKDTVKQSTYASYRSYLNKHFCVLGKILLKKLEPHRNFITTNSARKAYPPRPCATTTWHYTIAYSKQ